MSTIISILIPVHNSSATIREALLSCLAQTFTDFEIVIYNAGSSDHCAEIIRHISDQRIVYLESDTNSGIAASRNVLLRAAKGQYIAWLDADDIMMPDRLEKQLTYLESHPDVDILGSWISTDNEVLSVKRLPLTHEEIQHCLWFKNCMIQPAVMSRNFYVSEGIFYNESFVNSVEDYELWYRLRTVKKFANMDQILTHYHMTTGEDLIRKQHNNNFHKNIEMLWKKKWEAYPFILTDYQKSTFVEFIYENNPLSEVEISHLKEVFKQLESFEKDPFFGLLIAYHKLRMWRNMGWLKQLTNLHLLRDLNRWSEFKKHYLV